MDYVKSDFDLSVYWKTLNDNGITKERLLSYDRAIHSEPSFRREQKDGLLRDLGHYMRTLKVTSPSLLLAAFTNLAAPFFSKLGLISSFSFSYQGKSCNLWSSLFFLGCSFRGRP